MLFEPRLPIFCFAIGLALPSLTIGCGASPSGDPATCTSCHGGSEAGPLGAPPEALGGSDRRTARGVGAHRAHLNASLSAPVACSECHLVPTSVDAEGHIDSSWPAEVTWGDLATTGGAAIEWNTQALRCSGTYCHGATFASPGSHTDPVWTATDSSMTACGSCHQFPPPPPHPGSTDCGNCHSPTAVGSGLATRATHIDGILQVQVGGPTSCAVGCHGSAEAPAPPADTAGNSDAGSRGVGAHQVHLNATLGAPVQCGTCHPVPVSPNDGPHNDGNVDVVFSGVANRAGVVSSMTPGTQRCTTYCHGAAFQDGSLVPPVWTMTDDPPAACGSCHGNPPPPPHPASSSCSNCHGGGADNPTNHIDGITNF